jgi:indole-3-glycerol phosphate synthase
MSFLEEVVDSTKRAIAKRRRERSLSDLRASMPDRENDRDRVFARALWTPGISVIAEFKRSSPSKEALAPPDANVESYIDEYAAGGARALSILTEEHFFSGSLDDLRAARAKTDLPLLRKDFLIDEYQVYEAAEAGADAILLIAAVLQDDVKLRSLHELGRSLGMDVLLEVRGQTELQRALAIDADLIGINNRNLKTRPSRPRGFEVDITRTTKLLGDIPKDVTVVAESGLEGRAELDGLEAAGVHGALIGSALMEASDREAKCRELAGPLGAITGSPTTPQPALAS